MKLSHPLHRLLASKEICITPGVYDLITAKLAERAGFQMMIASFAPIAEWMLQQDWSRPSDTAATWQQLFLDQVKLICETVNVPVILDSHALYETPGALVEGAMLLERCGLAGIIVGDNGKEAQEPSLRALVSARHDSAFAIIASTQLRASATLADTIQHIKGYRSAGAEMVLLQGSGSMDELQAVPQEIVDLPLMIEMRDGAHMPLLSAYELQNLGYSIAYWQNLAISASSQVVWEAMRELKTLGKGRRPCSDETNGT